MIMQTRSCPQENLEVKMNKQMQTFSFSPSINVFEESKSLLAVSSLKCTISVFNITNETKSFSITILSHWESKSAEKTMNYINF